MHAPWTINQSVLSNSACTTGANDCTIVGISDGEKVLLMHLCPTEEKNKSINKIFRFISNNINKMRKEYLQGFVLCSKCISEESKALFNNIINYLEHSNIPFSYLKNGDDTYNIAYTSIHDIWFISGEKINNKLSSRDNIYNSFKDIKINELDEII